ncbi:MAG: hypothetical protein ACRDHX_13575 [Chloroflexota bacterium]
MRPHKGPSTYAGVLAHQRRAGDEAGGSAPYPRGVSAAYTKFERTYAGGKPSLNRPA